MHVYGVKNFCVGFQGEASERFHSRLANFSIDAFCNFANMLPALFEHFYIVIHHAVKTDHFFGINFREVFFEARACKMDLEFGREFWWDFWEFIGCIKATFKFDFAFWDQAFEDEVMESNIINNMLGKDPKKSSGCIFL